MYGGVHAPAKNDNANASDSHLGNTNLNLSHPFPSAKRLTAQFLASGAASHAAPYTSTP